LLASLGYHHVLRTSSFSLMAILPEVKSSLTAWERWELASFDEAGSRPLASAQNVADAVPPAPTFSTEEIAALREKARTEGFEAGRAAGYEEGHREGTAKGEAEAESAGREAVAALETVLGKFEEQLAQLDGAVAEEIVALGLEVARQVLRQSIAIKPESIVGVVREALTHLPLQHAGIYLHPDDASLVRSYAGEQLSHSGHRIHEDPKLAPGDVVIESGGSHLDATVATRWRRVLATLGQDSPWIDEPAESTGFPEAIVAP
jgi:flagellar assembly protein FliH